MKSALYISLPAEAGGPLLVAEEKGNRIELLQHQGPFPANASSVAFAPATVVSHFRVSLPARSDTDAAKAALYAIEDELAQPVEEVHIALGPRDKGKTERDVYVVDRNLLQSWFDQLAASGLYPERIVPENCLIDPDRDEMNLGSRVLKTHTGRIVGIDLTLPEAARGALDVPNEIDDQPEGSFLIRLAERYETRPTANLGSAGSAGRPRDQIDAWKSWRVAAGVAIAAASVWIGTLVLETRNYNYTAGQYYRQATDRYVAMFPNSPVPADIDQATRQMLAQSGGVREAGFLSSSALMYEALARIDQAQIETLNYSDNQLIAQIAFRNEESVSAVMAFLSERNPQVRLERASGEDGQPVARIIMENAP